MPIILITTGVALILIAISFRHIPLDHFAVVTFLGNPLSQTKRGGYRWFLFYPFIYNAILIKKSEEHLDVHSEALRTRDHTELKISASFTWAPNEDYATEYLNKGRTSGINKALTDMVKQQLGEWAASTDWKDSTNSGSRESITEFLLQSIAELSTSAIKGEITQKMNVARGAQPIPQLGITLNRMNVIKIEPIGKLPEDAEEDLLAVRLRARKTIDMHHVGGLIQELSEKLKISTEFAEKIVHTDPEKIERKILDICGDMSSDTLLTAKRLIEDIWAKSDKAK